MNPLNSNIWRNENIPVIWEPWKKKYALLPTIVNQDKAPVWLDYYYERRGRRVLKGNSPPLDYVKQRATFLDLLKPEYQ